MTLSGIKNIKNLYFKLTFCFLFLKVVIFLLCHALIILANEKPFKEIIEVDTSLLDYSKTKHLSRRPKRLQEPVVYEK